MSKKANHRRDMVLLRTLLAIIVFLLILPLVYVVGGPFKFMEEFLLGGFKIFPETRHPENYMKAWKQANSARYILDNVSFAVASMISIIIISSMTGYAMSRCDLPGKELLIDTFGFAMFLIGVVTLLPTFQPCCKLGLLNSIWGMVITQIAAARPFYCILIMGYCSRILKEIDKAATIGGASFFKIYTAILVPIVKPILATIGILTFGDTWNSYMMPLVFALSRSELRPLVVGVALLKDQDDGATVWNTMLAGTVMFIAPILIVYLFLNWCSIEGITTGAVKG